MRKQFRILKSRLGETRVIYKFLWLPTWIGDELRWLESACIIQEVKEIDVGGSMEWDNFGYRWINVQWFDGDTPKTLSNDERNR